MAEGAGRTLAAASARVDAAVARGLLQVRPVSIHTGAEISGIDLARGVSEEQAAAVRDALLRWKVVFFREQHIDHAQHVALARRLGGALGTEPTLAHPVFPEHVDGHPEVYPVAKHRTAVSRGGAEGAPVESRAPAPWSGWHTDITAAVNPPSVSVLRGVTLPPYGGDTLWANLAAAHDGLSPPLRGFLAGLHGVHRYSAPAGAGGAAYAERVRNRVMVTAHPLVTVHPDTQERVLCVSPAYLKSLRPLRPRESELLIQMLWEHALRPEYQVRWRWSAGDVAVWDNRSTMHRAPTDVYATDHDRLLYRVTLHGSAYRGVGSGMASEALQGEPILPAAEDLRRRSRL